ncbi:MAG: arginine--tRNA ligase [Spirochaetaceae bacterium]|jgi:arginyl-tRNA synthetase|nr:arginine--tRNA ligase [Spirochaetaceae bacterium]
MKDFKEPWKISISSALNRMLREAGMEGRVDASEVIAETPPRPELGDLGFPMFGFAKRLRQSPSRIAAALAAALSADPAAQGVAITPEGPYVNIRLNRAETAAAILANVLGEGETGGVAEETPGRPGTLKGSRIMVEFSSPNTNKPLHLGHLRNDVLGESISRILAACGAEVRKVCIINDRGVHICKSMLAYRELGQGKTPLSEGVKSDRFVGDWYVQFHRMSETDAGAEGRAQDLLRKWEAGDEETVALWKQMNTWAVEGIQETYRRTGVSFDQYYYESRTYLLGREEVLKGLEEGIFYREAGGAVAVDLNAEKLGEKVLLRKDGTSIYITQDIGTAILRRRDWPFDRLIFVVGSEQRYHFQALFAILGRLGFDWAKNLYHLSYGMVNLPEGKMKSREGTVVDADDLLDSLKELALQEIRAKDREAAVGDSEGAAEKIALGALHYYLLAASPAKDMLFNPQESLSFNGDTGPYLQYMGARISSMLRKEAVLRGEAVLRNETAPAGDAEVSGETAGGSCRPELLDTDAEWELLKTLAGYSGVVAEAAEKMDPSLLAAYLYELSRSFSRFYHDCPVLNAGTPDLTASRLALSRGVLRVLRDALNLICIPFLETM